MKKVLYLSAMFLFVCCANLYAQPEDLYDDKPCGIRHYHSNEVKT